MIENELSFLVTTLPDLSSVPFEKIDQHYLSVGKEPLRMRKIGEQYELTKKFSIIQGDHSRKDELTIPLRQEEFEMFLPHSKKALTKTRYYFPLIGELTGEIDIFHGMLDGLVMVEVEFADEKTRSAFKPLAWFGRNVSQEKWSSNAYLADKTFADIQQFLL